MIVSTALHLNRIFGEEITSCDLGTVRVSTGSPFDPATAEDIGGEVGSRKAADVVLCTTEVGLIRTARDAKGAKVEETLLLKPKVALQSVAVGLPISNAGH